MNLRALSWSDAVICNSEAGARATRASSRAGGKIHVIENGTDTAAYCFDGGSRLKCRQDWGVSESEPLIGIVGRHDPIKGHSLFFAAAARLLLTHPAARFVVVGGEVAGVTDHLRMSAAELGLADRLIWAGHRSDLSTVYSALDLLCLASESEGFPNVVAEAMSCGLPCVCTDVGDVRRLLDDCGWIAAGRTPELLASSLSLAVNALPSWNRNRPRQRVVQNFGTETMVDRTLAVLQTLMEPRT